MKSDKDIATIKRVTFLRHSVCVHGKERAAETIKCNRYSTLPDLLEMTQH